MLQLVKNPLISLYQFADSAIKTHFYYIKQNGSPVELILHYLYSEQSSKSEHNTSYKQQLASLSTGCHPFENRTENLKYRQKEMQDFIVRYLNCVDPASDVEIKKKKNLPVKFGMFAGVMSNSYNFEGNYNDLAKFNYGNNVSPLFSVSSDIGLSHDYDKLYIVNELLYKRYEIKSDTYSGSYPSGFN